MEAVGLGFSEVHERWVCMYVYNYAYFGLKKKSKTDITASVQDKKSKYIHKIAVEKLPPSQLSSFGIPHLCEGGSKTQTRYLRGRSFSSAIFNSDTQLIVYSFSYCIYVCPFVALLTATNAENSIVKSVHLLTSCVF